MGYFSRVQHLSRNYHDPMDTAMLRAFALPLNMASASGIPFVGIAGKTVQDIVNICKELKLYKVRLVIVGFQTEHSLRYSKSHSYYRTNVYRFLMS